MTRKLPTQRILTFENLQSRRLLAADLAPPVELLACVPEPAVELARPAGDIAAPMQDWSEEAASLVAAEPEARTSWNEDQAEGEPGGTSQAPFQLNYFEIVITNNGMWQISGEVEYDGDMNDVQVVFGEDGEGLSTGVAQDGSFSLFISPISNPESGIMSAQAFAPGLASPMRFTELPE